MMGLAPNSPQIQSAIYGDIEKLAPLRQKQGAGQDIPELVSQVGGRPPSAATPGAAAPGPAPAQAAAPNIAPEAEQAIRLERQLAQRRDFFFAIAMQPGASEESIQYALAALEEHKAAYEEAYKLTPNARFQRG